MSIPGEAGGSFCPGSLDGKNSAYPRFRDAADGLKSGENLAPQANGLGVLLTADGGRYEGKLFGAEGVGEGELVFTTGMMGYQESLTDPSFACLLYTSPSPRDE